MGVLLLDELIFKFSSPQLCDDKVQAFTMELVRYILNS